MAGSAPPEVRKFFDDVRVGNHRRALGHADDLAVKCSASRIARRHTPAVILLHGELLAGQEELVRAVAYLEQGLVMLGETGRHEVVGTGDRHRAILIGLLLQLGRYAPAVPHIAPLEEPHRSLESRFVAARARAHLAAVGGRPEDGHQFLNTAASLANRIKGGFPVALVDADRSVLLATQGRLFEAVALADHVLPKLLRPVRGSYGRWAGASLQAVAFTMSRHCIDQGRGPDAERFLVAGISGVERAPSLFGTSNMELAMARAWRNRRELDQAEAALRKAAAGFGHLGCAPGLALVSLEEACLAEVRRLGTSTRALFERALAEFEELGHAWEVSVLRHHLGVVRERAPVAAASQMGPSPIDMRSSRRERMLG